MPLYEYECSKCNKVHEVIQKLSDAPLGQCPVCGGEVRKLMSNTSFMLKGTGWYATDYKKAGKSTSDSKSSQSTSSSKGCCSGACSH